MDGTIATLHHGISAVAAYSFRKRVNSGAYLEPAGRQDRFDSGTTT
jgi:hypothetical protein